MYVDFCAYEHKSFTTSSFHCTQIDCLFYYIFIDLYMVFSVFLSNLKIRFALQFIVSLVMQFIIICM